ncbi:MAG: aldo/keto reductase [Planctomycetota bacterium]
MPETDPPKPPPFGLGTGGESRLGLLRGQPESHAIGLIQYALQQGVTYLDTAADYDNESVVGQAIADHPRESIYLATKVGTQRFKRLRTPGSVRRSLRRSLKRLGTDYLDLFQFHAVRPYQYDAVRKHLFPVLQELQRDGVIRAIGITEKQSQDRNHTLMAKAARDPAWDTLMIAHSLDHPSAGDTIIPTAAANHTAVIGMCALRRLFRDPALFRHWSQGLQLDKPALADLAYRYTRHTPGMHSVLFSASSKAQIDANLAALQGPPLTEADHQRITQIQCIDPHPCSG